MADGRRKGGLLFALPVSTAPSKIGRRPFYTRSPYVSSVCVRKGGADNILFSSEMTLFAQHRKISPEVATPFDGARARRE